METVKLRSYEKLEEENKELRTMMRKLCHEMGNALTLLGGSIYYLENELKTMKGRSELANVKDDYSYLCRLFNNLRDYNHFEAVDKENISLTELAHNISAVFDRLNAAGDVNYKYSRVVDTDDIYVYVDITKMRQVMINIIKNSMEAMNDNSDDKGKNILVRMSLEYGPEEKCSRQKITPPISMEKCNLKNNHTENYGTEIKRKSPNIAHIEIRDNGKGVPEENISDIFEPMFTYGKKQGAGLGLSVVKRIVEDHRGKIKAVSALGTGTAMHIYLPIAQKLS